MTDLTTLFALLVAVFFAPFAAIGALIMAAYLAFTIVAIVVDVFSPAEIQTAE
jgi:hypothetical protein